MDYAEHPLPAVLAPWVKAVWSLRLAGEPGEWFDQQALPDGCIELILRTAGRSHWDRPQPPRFVAGLATRPAHFRVSGDSAFVGVRLWPWTWLELSGETCAGWTDCWSAAAPGLCSDLVQDSPDASTARLCAILANRAVPELARAIPFASTVAEIAASSGWGNRKIQRWFEKTIGVAPSAYLKLLRFQVALSRIAASSESLALHAADAGYADHAHMARDIRNVAGIKPSVLRKRLTGPFVT